MCAGVCSTFIRPTDPLTNLPWSLPDPPRAEVFCRPIPASRSLHHELYQQYSSFPDCRQREALPALLLRTTPEHSATNWTDPIDINCPGTQVGL